MKAVILSIFICSLSIGSVCLAAPVPEAPETKRESRFLKFEGAPNRVVVESEIGPGNQYYLIIKIDGIQKAKINADRDLWMVNGIRDKYNALIKAANFNENLIKIDTKPFLTSKKPQDIANMIIESEPKEEPAPTNEELKDLKVRVKDLEEKLAQQNSRPVEIRYVYTPPTC
jgi:hypothetical protein